MANRFEQVDEPAEDAITVAILETASGLAAKISCRVRRPKPWPRTGRATS